MVRRFGDQHFSGDFFPTLRFEGEIFDCEVEGEIPRDIRGTFYRLGGDWLYPPVSPHDAPFSADGYLSMFRFWNGRVDYRGRFVRTPRYVANRNARRQLFGIYRNRSADDPSVRSLSSTVANTTPVVHAGRLFATKEDARPYEIDPHTLETRGEWDFYGKFASLTCTAHPKIDPVTGEMICFGYEATGEASRDVFVYFIDRSGHVTREVRLEAPYVSEMHDMAITRTHVVLPMYPLTTDKQWLAQGNIHWYWDERLPGYLCVLPRDGTARDARWIKGPPHAMVHTLNATTEKNRLVVDGSVSDGNPFPFFPNRYGAPWSPESGTSTIRRWTLDLDSKHEGWEEQRPFPMAPGGLPRIDDRFTSMPYRYGYMGYSDPTRPRDEKLAAGRAFPMTNCLGRYHVGSGKLDTLFVGSDGTLQEACFVPKSSTATEGEGYLVGVYSNLAAARSELIVVDALRMEELARVILPFQISVQVHGCWASYDDLPFEM
ncbi:MAG TPA: carotenoid oxygenase family protein [Steroidobacteraceae bacterium]|nr:carotenoid oxygenase family protein [Steroidobacteraceae bacterium]